MNEESFNIIANQKRSIDNLQDYVDAGFKICFERSKKNKRSINFVGFCVGFMTVVLYEQNKRIKKLEQSLENNKVEEIEKNEDVLEEVAATEAE